MTLNLLLNPVELIGEGLASVALLHGEDAFEGLLLRTEDLHLLFVSIQLLLELPNRVVQVVQLSLQVGGVVSTTRIEGHIVEAASGAGATSVLNG